MSAEHLEQFIVILGGKLIQGAGNVSHQQALGKAEAKYTTFRTQQCEQPPQVETAFQETVSRMGGLSLLARTSREDDYRETWAFFEGTSINPV